MRFSPFVPLFVVLMPVARVSAQGPVYSVFGQRSKNVGNAVASAGDVDNDGVGDFLVAGSGFGSWSKRANPSVRVFSGVDGHQLLVIPSPSTADGFGWAVTGGADFDGDGHDDIVVSSPFERGHGVVSGRVRAYSGKTGKQIHEFQPLWEGDQFGISVAMAGDVDKDGVGDVVIGANRGPARTDYGLAMVYSGKTGGMLRIATGMNSVERIGWTVAGAGDVDNDGYPDFMAGAENRPVAYVFSGRDGKLLYTKTPQNRSSVAGAGDLDGDGYADFMLGTSRGRDVIVYSGKDGSELRKLTSLGGDFGTTLCAVPDIDGDSIGDLAVGAPSIGVVGLFSGKTGGLLFRLSGSSSARQFGSSLAVIPAFEHNKAPLLLVGAMFDTMTGVDAGSATVFALRPMPLTADVVAATIQGGKQKLALAAGKAHAGKVYLVLGTLSGTMPGVKLGSLTLPLNADAYFGLTLTNPNAPPLASSLGFLSAEGNGSTSFAFPPSTPPALVGMTLHHAFAVLDVRASSIDFTSNAVRLDIYP